MPRKRKSTLDSLGLPTTWWHGTITDFDRLSFAKNVLGVAWLADFATAREYADKHYASAERRTMIGVELDPETIVLDLTDPDEPFVDELVALVNEASRARYGELGNRTREDWLGNQYQYGVLESYPFIVGLLKKRKVGGIILNDVAGWGSHEPTKSLALLSKKAILNETRQRLSDLAATPNGGQREVSLEAAEALAALIEAQKGAPRARVWRPERAGTSPRVYLGDAGYLSVDGVEVHGLAPKAGLRAARVTLDLGGLYPAQRTALRRALEVYSEVYAIPKLEELDEAALGRHEAERVAVLEAVQAGARTRKAIAAATGISPFRLGSVLDALADDGEVFVRSRGTTSETILA